MKLKKNLAAAALATAMVASLATPVFAADENKVTDLTQNATKSTTVTYNVTGGYTWTVPAKVDFGKDMGINNSSVVGKAQTAEGNQVADGTTKVTVDDNIIPDGQKLQINVKAAANYYVDGSYVIKNGGTSLNYTIKKNGESAALGDDAEVLTVVAGTKAGEQKLDFTLTTKQDSTEKASEVAGAYTGNLVFTASIVENN